MDLKDQARREPTMADLEAFERLLRDSLHSSPQAGSLPTAPSAAPLTEAPRGLDANAMAELTRLIHEPLSFEVRGQGTEQPSAQAEQPYVHEQGAEPLPSPRFTESSISWQQLEAIPPADEPMQTVFSPRSAEVQSHDPLRAFEDELRRFDERPALAPLGELRDDFAGSAELATVAQAQGHGHAGHDPWLAEQALMEPDAPPSALDEAERRLAAQAALAAAAAGAVGAGGAVAASRGRSRAVFLGLGGVAAIGLTVIAGTMFFGERKANTGGVPVVAAKQEPTKERPANPGGVEIPDQNRQVLAPKTATEPPKPAQAVNTTEQPMDLNQVTRRDNVRVIAPSPFQNNAQGQAPVTEAAPPAPQEPASTEPRRVQSVRIGEAPAPVAQPTTPGVSAGLVGAGAAGAATIAAITAARGTSAPAPIPPAGSTPGRVMTAPSAALPQAQPPAPAPAVPKVETRPQSAVAAATTPPRPAVAPTPRPAPPAAQAPAPRPANAPLPLTNNRPAQQASAPAATQGGGGWAVQLASRPTQDDARSAASQLGGRFSGALGGRSPGVVSGEANGRTVYRVRASGYSQAEANTACERVKAAGGQCFVTR